MGAGGGSKGAGLTERQRCLVVDGHPLVRLGLRRLLDGFELEEAASRREAVDLVRDLGAFDIAVLNVDVHGSSHSDELSGGDAIRELHKAEPAMRIVAYGAPPERHLATAALGAGATAFVSRRAGPDEVAQGVSAAIDGERFVDAAVPPAGKRGKLTRRQRQLLQLLAEGKSTSFAARQLELSEETVKTHTKNILSRLGARNRSHAIAIALRESLID